MSQIYRFSRKQLTEIWSSTNTETMEEDIGHILDLIDYNGGHLITDKTMSYLMDRLEVQYYTYIRTKLLPKIKLIRITNILLHPFFISI